MSSKLKAGTSTSGAVLEADTTGILEIQTGSTPTTAVTIDASQNVTLNNVIPSGSTAPTNGMFLPATNSVGFSTASTERMRIDSSGNLLVGTATAWVSLANKSVQVANASGLGQYAGGPGNSSQTYTFGRDNVTTGNFVFTYNGNVISSITSTTGVYTPLSDSRVKKNITPLQYGLNEILKLNPVIYNMKTEEDSVKKHIGLIAQEVKSVMDESVDDLIDQENQMYGLDKSGLVPVLIKAIQELNAKVTDLEAKLGAKP